MRFSPISFLLGLGAASVLPIIARAFRPFAVEATALGMTVADEVRRIAAEQMENLEDLVAEARVRREEMAAAAGLGAESETEPPDTGAETMREEPAPARTAGRSTGQAGA
jgi:hypothetical protein